jgi:hypothetical protein
VVGLQPAKGGHSPRSLLQGFRQQVFQLARFVSPHPGPDLIVALYVHRPARFCAQTRQKFQRSGVLRQWKTRDEVQLSLKGFQGVHEI